MADDQLNEADILQCRGAFSVANERPSVCIQQIAWCWGFQQDDAACSALASSRCQTLLPITAGKHIAPASSSPQLHTTTTAHHVCRSVSRPQWHIFAAGACSHQARSALLPAPSHVQYPHQHPPYHPINGAGSLRHDHLARARRRCHRANGKLRLRHAAERKSPYTVPKKTTQSNSVI